MVLRSTWGSRSSIPENEGAETRKKATQNALRGVIKGLMNGPVCFQQLFHVEKFTASQSASSTRSTCSSLSISLSFTSMISRREVGTVRPMKRASMGSSRWPRSMRTRSWTLLGRPWSKRASSAARSGAGAAVSAVWVRGRPGRNRGARSASKRRRAPDRRSSRSISARPTSARRAADPFRRARAAHVERRQHQIVFERGTEGEQRGIGRRGDERCGLGF